MSNLVILKWRTYEYKAKFEKSFLFRSEIGIFDRFFKDCTKKIFNIYKSIPV